MAETFTMGRCRTIPLLLIAVLMAGGCAGASHRATASPLSSRQEVFRETHEPRPPENAALLDIDFSVKANRARIVTSYLKHTDPPYTATVTIDGQSMELTDEPFLEETPGDSRTNPEAGIGWRYRFRKKLLLAPGLHRIAISVPLSAIHTEKSLELEKGLNYLKIVPIYDASLVRDRNVPKFSRGVRGVTLQLNRHEL